MIVEDWEMKAADHLMDSAHLDPITWWYAVKKRMADKKGWIMVFKTHGVIPQVKAMPIMDKEIARL